MTESGLDVSCLLSQGLDKCKPNSNSTSYSPHQTHDFVVSARALRAQLNDCSASTATCSLKLQTAPRFNVPLTLSPEVIQDDASRCLERRESKFMHERLQSSHCKTLAALLSKPLPLVQDLPHMVCLELTLLSTGFTAKC